jgi:hypothetical protein
MYEQEEPDEESYAEGWRGTIQEAADAALGAEQVEIGPTREIVVYGRKKNPIHEFRVALKPDR